MVGSAALRLGGLERRVMEHLWADASGERWFTVREVHEELAREREIAYTTVMTVLQRLAKKRLALEAREGRAYLYRATSSGAALTADAMREVLTSASPRDRLDALRRFLETLTPPESAALREALGASTGAMVEQALWTSGTARQPPAPRRYQPVP